jgi:hypothetical protein
MTKRLQPTSTTDRLNRRELLKRSSIVAGGLTMAASGLPIGAMASGAPRAGALQSRVQGNPTL